MKTSIQILPGIKAIGRLDCRLLPARVDLHGITRNVVGVFTDVYPVEFFDTPECSCTTERENGGYKDTASLKFFCGELLPLHLPLGFVVTDISGRHYLIGAREHPFPQVKVERQCGAPDGDAAGYYYEVTHVSIKSMVPCKI